MADEISNVDPAQAGWQSESFSEAVAVQMKSVAKLLVHPEELDAGALGPLVAGGFVSGALRPGALELINAEGGAVRISGAAAAGTGDEAYRGAEGFARALVALAAVLKIRGRAKDKGTGY